MDLRSLGWDEIVAGRFAPYADKRLLPARVTLEHQHIYRVQAEADELLAVVAGHLRHRATGPQDYPAVGDWVAVRPPTPGHRAVIQAVLPRKSKFSRKVAGDEAVEQVVAANVDTVFIVMGLDRDYSLRRVERYLITAWDGGAAPAVVLNKADVCEDVGAAVSEVQSVAPGVSVHAISTRCDPDLACLDPYLEPGRTVALLGSSGVGKSTIVNRLVGEEVQRTREVRESDQRGRHTTSHRQLIRLPGGALLIDTPGMRELQLWDGAAGVGAAFGDVEAFAPKCRFGDCRHDTEPGCAVKAAVDDGDLDANRLESYRQLQRERKWLLARIDERTAQDRKRYEKMIGKIARDFKPRE
ncbi:MAG: ribosome small subunit-dependent GTPase A [Acidobacteriota bacterium]